MSQLNNVLRVKNNEITSLDQVSIMPYADFSLLVLELFREETHHCASYFAFRRGEDLQFLMAIASDVNHDIILLSHRINISGTLELHSLSREIPALHIFEREIHENYGVEFQDHPWQKPVRFAHNRANKNLNINDYPFYSIESEELHEVGVGPIHAGVIEPGHFRFICNGERVLHLEIQLGWQHRGIEQLFLDKHNNLARNILAENIAGDSVIGHTTTFVQNIEALSGTHISPQTQIERAVALELERIAVHTGDISALCTDAAYNFGANVFAVLRTDIINFTQSWCGNRFGKGLVRIGGSYYPLTGDLRRRLRQVIDTYEKRFEEAVSLVFHLPGIQNRFENVGEISREQVILLGAVGPVARMRNLARDIRLSHPPSAYQAYPIENTIIDKGDVFARFYLRKMEIRNSLAWIRKVLLDRQTYDIPLEKPDFRVALKGENLVVSLAEGWRGEIAHCAITDNHGTLTCYKVKDPSMHNWKALELSLRNVDISDFPINNKSYDLSYCGHDL